MSERDSGLRIVSLGGGTGLSSLLSGLKAYVGPDSSVAVANELPWIETLTAVVTVTDDGGSSGRLREEFQMLPPGDIRNCMVALAEDELLLTKLFQYRFESSGNLSGHSFGNLFLTALAGVTGDFLEAIKASSEVLAIKGRIFPSTIEDVTLVAELENGQLIEGESNIVASRGRIKKLRLSKNCCKPLPETLEAIKNADLITIGPGSLYTSVISNLLVEDIVAAMAESPALKVYVCNIMTQPGETDGFSVEEHLRVLYDYSPDLKLDCVIVNSAPIHSPLKEKYLADGAIQVEFESSRDRSTPRSKEVETRISDRHHQVSIVCDDLLYEKDLVRHDPTRLAQLLLRLLRMERLTALNIVGAY